MPPVSLETLAGLTGRLVSLGLVHATWIGLFLAAATAIAFHLLPRLSHGTRHCILTWSLIGTVLAPCLAVAFQRAWIPSHHAAKPASVRVSVSRAEPVETSQVERETPARMPSKLESDFSISIGRIWIDLVEMIEITQPYVLGIWLVAVASFSLRLVLAGWAVWRLVRGSELAASEIQARTNELAARLGLRRVPPVLVNHGLPEPGLSGIFRPRILLPRTWLDGSIPDQLDAILAHELAHAKRRDLPANLVQRLVETALFFHPAVRWISKTLRRERELCTDALAVSLTGDPIALASALESVARLRLCHSSLRSRNSMLGASIGGESPSLLPRIQELLGMTPTLPARRPIWPFASIPAAGLLAILGASLGLAGDPPKVATPVERSSAKAASPSISSGPHILVKSDGNSGEQRQDRSKPSEERMYSFEVRFLTVADLSWRKIFKNQIQVIQGKGEANAWIIQDKKTLQEFLVSIQGSQMTNVLQAPRVTTFEGQRATFLAPRGYDLAELQDLNPSGSEQFRPITRPIPLGSYLNISARSQTGRIQLEAEVLDTTLVPSHEQKGIERNPGLLTKRSHLAKDIPNEASLLMSMGQRESQDSHLTDQKELKTDGVKLERLVLITPRPIILESEESHLPRPAPEIKSSAAGKRSTPNSLPIEIKSEDGKFDFDKTLIGYYQALRVAEGSNPNKQAHSGSEQRPAVKPIQIQGKLNGTIIGVPTPAPMPLHP